MMHQPEGDEDSFAYFDPNEKLTLGEFVCRTLRIWEMLSENYRCHMRGRKDERVRIDHLEIAGKVLAKTYYAEEMCFGQEGLKYYEQQINRLNTSCTGDERHSTGSVEGNTTPAQ